MDFTVNKYRALLSGLKAYDFEFFTYNEFHDSQKYDVRKITLRHDVDDRKENSLLFAKIQSSENIKATYYFRVVPQSYDERIIREISSLGHEVGYHYETMDTSRGNVDRAYEEFCRYLEKFRKIVPIHTICMHGSPLSRFDNREIWHKYDYRKLGIKAEPYFDLDFNRTFYLTDTGRRWDGGKVSMRDKAMSGTQINNSEFLLKSYHSTDQIIDALNNGSFPKNVMMTFHPQRWSNNPLEWSQELLFQNLKNQLKRLLVKRR